MQSRSIELLQLKDEGMKSIEILENTNREKEKLEVILRAKDDEVDFLRSPCIPTNAINLSIGLTSND